MGFVHAVRPVVALSRISAVRAEEQKTPRASGVQACDMAIGSPLSISSALRHGFQPGGTEPRDAVRVSARPTPPAVLAGAPPITAAALAPATPRRAATATAAHSFVLLRRSGSTRSTHSVLSVLSTAGARSPAPGPR